MTWDYRIVRRIHDTGEIFYGIHEVHYDKDQTPVNLTENPQPVVSDEGIEGVRWHLEHMLEALGKPVLDYDKDFPAASE